MSSRNNEQSGSSGWLGIAALVGAAAAGAAYLYSEYTDSQANQQHATVNNQRSRAAVLQHANSLNTRPTSQTTSRNRGNSTSTGGRNNTPRGSHNNTRRGSHNNASRGSHNTTSRSSQDNRRSHNAASRGSDNTTSRAEQNTTSRSTPDITPSSDTTETNTTQSASSQQACDSTVRPYIGIKVCEICSYDGGDMVELFCTKVYHTACIQSYANTTELKCPKCLLDSAQ